MRNLLALIAALALATACNGQLPDDTENPVRDVDVDGFSADEDCNDNDPSIYPGAPDTPYDGVDSDCGGEDDFDVDGDGWNGEGGGGTDCDDLDPAVNPAREERCNDIDDDCNGSVDDNPSNPKTFYADNDGDGVGDTNSSIKACTAPDGYVTKKNDCDDSRADVKPGAPSVACDGYDNDCDGKLTDEDGGSRIGTTLYADAYEALEAAVEGDVIELCEGEHDTSLEIDKAVTIRGTATNPDWVRLAGDGGTAVTVLAAGVTLENLRISGGSSDDIGGGLLVSAKTTLLRNAIVTDNSAAQGAGIAVTSAGELVLADVIIEKNTATGDFNEGGGVYLAAFTKITGSRVTIESNTAEFGGGAFVSDGATLALDSASLIKKNTATGQEGGGLALETGANFSGGVVENNIGGGIWVYGNDTQPGEIADTTVRNHTSNTSDGAGIHLEGPSDLTHVTLTSNKTTGTGGGIWLNDPGDIQMHFDDVVLEKNDAATAGGLYFEDGTVFMTGVNFGEGANANKNGALQFADGSEPPVSTSMFTTCTADGSTGSCL